jgi:hypothetical protein
MAARRLLVVIQRQYPRHRRAEYLRSDDWQHCLRLADFRHPRPGDCRAWANYPSMADYLQLGRHLVV